MSVDRSRVKEIYRDETGVITYGYDDLMRNQHCKVKNCIVNITRSYRELNVSPRPRFYYSCDKSDKIYNYHANGEKYTTCVSGANCTKKCACFNCLAACGDEQKWGGQSATRVDENCYDLNSWIQEVFEVLEAQGIDYFGESYYEANQNMNNLKQKMKSGVTLSAEELQLFHNVMQKTRYFLNANTASSQGFGSFAKDVQKFDRCYKIYLRLYYRKGQEEPPNNHSACYIATAVYGSYNASEVLTLRLFRDEVLAKSLLGRLIINLYYAISPGIAEALKHKSMANQFVRNVLDRFVVYLDSKRSA